MGREVRHVPEEHRFVVTEDGIVGYAEYEISGDFFDILHTIVPKEIGGRGIASDLVEAAYSYALSKGFRLRSTCPYAAVWLERHPDFKG